MAYEPQSEEEEKTYKLILATCSALGGLEDKETIHGKIERVYCVGDEALGIIHICIPFIYFIFFKATLFNRFIYFMI